jgi:tetratricopeptide (TPR) repeat protein
MGRIAIAITAAITALAGGAASFAATPLSVRDSWRIGSSGTSFCSAQSLTTDKALTGMFDAGYSITCRDAALPVGKLYKLKDSSSAAERIVADRNERANCGQPRRGNVGGLGAVDVVDCRLKDANVTYRAYVLRRGSLVYAVQGLAGYDSALQLGLRSLVADQPEKGEISIATTGLGDPAAFARVQAGTLAPDKALEEAYRRNNAGSYAEAAEFFAAASSASGDTPVGRAEALVNEALQKSNLGRFAEADSLFARAAELVGSEPVVARRLRNYRAIHDLNQGDVKAALAELDKQLPKNATGGRTDGTATLEINSAMSRRLNADSKFGRQLGAQSDELLPDEKIEILDGQAHQLRGTALRLSGDRAGAREALRRADGELLAVRGGKVASILWIRRSRCTCRRRRRPRQRQSALWPGSGPARGQLSGQRRSSELEGAPCRLSCAQRAGGGRGSDVQRDRPFAAGYEQPAPELRQRPSPLRRPAAQEGRRSQGHRRSLRCDPADGSSRPCPDASRPRA